MKEKKKTDKELNKSPHTEEKTYDHGKHPNSIANLRPYKKGESGNPGGRTVKYAKLRKALNKWKNIEMDYDYWDIPPKQCKTLKDQVHW